MSKKQACYTRQGYTTSGNYVWAAFDQSKNTLKVIYVLTAKCDPKPDDCNCKSLLDTVVEKFKTATKIALLFSANPAIAGCK